MNELVKEEIKEEVELTDGTKAFTSASLLVLNGKRTKEGRNKRKHGGLGATAEKSKATIAASPVFENDAANRAFTSAAACSICHASSLLE